MAGDWIPVDHVLPDKPEVCSIAAELGIGIDECVGRLIRVWAWFDQQTTDGRTRLSTDFGGNGCVTVRAHIDHVSGVTGFAVAMENAGWLCVESGCAVQPNFETHGGQSAKARLKTAKRVARFRKRGCNVSNVTKSLPQNRTEQKRDTGVPVSTPLPPTGGDGFPECLRTDRFAEAWTLWQQHHAEIKKPLKPTTCRTQLKKLEAMGHDRAIAAIEHSVANGWQGLFEPTARGNQSQAAGAKRKPTAEERGEYPESDDPLPIWRPGEDADRGGSV